MTRLMTTKETAEFLGITRQAVYLAITSKKLKSVKGHGMYAKNRLFVDEKDARDYRKNAFSRDKSMYKGELLYNVAKGEYSLRKAADYLQINYSTMYYYVRKGRIPSIKRGSAWILRKEDLDFLAKELDELLNIKQR